MKTVVFTGCGFLIIMIPVYHGVKVEEYCYADGKINQVSSKAKLNMILSVDWYSYSLYQFNNIQDSPVSNSENLDADVLDSFRVREWGIGSLTGCQSRELCKSIEINQQKNK